MERFEHFIPIPKPFWSFETGRPMSRCSACERDLMEEGTCYFIEKAFLERETVFELALCLDCHLQFRDEISLESRERIDRYFEERIDIEKRMEQRIEQFGTDFEKWIEHCMIKGYPARECREYQLFGCCIDKDLLFNGAPYILCGEVMDEIVELLSPETLGVVGDFTEQLFGIDAPKDLLVL